MDATRSNRREDLLVTAARFFLAKGYSAASVDEIAEAAGTSGPALYRLFDSKQDLLDQLCLAGMEMRLKGMQEVLDKDLADPRDTLRELVRARIDFALGPWGYQVPITLAEYQHLSPAAAKKIDAASQVGAAEWFRHLSRLRAETSTRDVLTIIYTVLMEITYFTLNLRDADVQSDVRPFLLRVAMAGLTGEPSNGDSALKAA